MYAVEKIGSYISRGVYTVSGPFHPFGGAVDIIVVQQQDGSFKSSPWYVRFGKFQGVLKTKEKLVKISVNGVEAGFNMYLDHKGEAFFLRDAEAGGLEFVLSPPSSGDEIEEKTKNGQVKKMKSFGAEGREKEITNLVDTGNGKVVARTRSRRSTIFGLVFGRKSIKENNMCGNVERVSSLERAEIAADLLEVKWSTNRTCSDRVDPKVKQSDKREMNVCAAHEEYPQALLPKDCLHACEKLNPNGETMGDRDFSEDARVGNPSGLMAIKETVELRTSETDDKSIPDRENAEFVFRSPIVDTEFCNLDYNGNFDDSFVSHVEGLGDAHRNNILTEKDFEDMTSHDEVLQTYTSEVNGTADRNKLISGLATVQSDETDAQNAASLVSYDDEVVSRTKSHVGSTADVSTYESGGKGITSFGYSQTPESSTVKLNISGEKIFDHLGSLSNVSELGEITSNMVPEDSSLSLLVPSSGKEISNDYHQWSLETCSYSESYVSGISHDDPTSGAFKVSDKNCFYTHSEPCSSSEQISSGVSFSTNQQMLSCGHENLSIEAIKEESIPAQETDIQQIDFLGSPQMEESQGAQVPLLPTSTSGNPLDFCTPTVSHTSSGILDTCNPKSAIQELESFEIGDNLKRSYSLEINVAQDFGVVSMPTEVTEYSVPCSESSEDVQFPFSDIENFGAKEIGTEISDNSKIGETDDQKIISSEHDLEEHDLQSKNDKQFPEEESIAFRSHSSPIHVPVFMTTSGENELSSKSLPVVRSHVKDLEESDFHHSLSCSLVERAGISKVDDAVSTADNEEEPKGSLTNSTVELSLCKHLLFEGMGEDAAREIFDTEKVNLEKFAAMGPSVVKNERLVVRIGGRYFPWETAAPIVLGMICFGHKSIFEPQGMIHVGRAEKKNGASRSIPSRGSWNLWPFMKRSKTISNAHETTEGTQEVGRYSAARSTENMLQESDMLKSKNYKKVQSLMPTSEELASLNLKEGLNVVKFTFSTPMLGLQQVDARIYLWKWDTQIVISDVDGTITKSDVLGQFMPLVGVDWSQTGVAHLFSAIKDNGYQLLFLSARAISQAHLTRQFLFNLKQDGKALPDGPVVISPDGLFPSLYREVIRRAPHEFKISCLEAIQALFPPDCNPFYAGFGNRDTDEISYLKVGIPIGKIFIINPKGQVAVNRRVDTKSYTSLHELVNGIFPPMSSFEREDFNEWNYWKLPLPEVDI